MFQQKMDFGFCSKKKDWSFILRVGKGDLRAWWTFFKCTWTPY